MKSYTFVQNLNNTEVIVTATAVGFIKGFIHCIFLIALGAYYLGCLMRSVYEEYIKDESIQAAKLLAASLHETEEDNVEKIETTIDTSDFWIAMNEEIARFEDRVPPTEETQNDSEYQMQMHTIELPAAHDFKVPYYDWKAGRCKKGYRKIGNQCVLKEYVQYV